MAKFRKKQIVIEAFKWLTDEVPIWWKETQGITINVETGSAFIPTNEGVMEACKGDYIIKEPFPTNDRTIYPCKPDIFEKTYEEVEDTDSLAYRLAHPEIRN